MNEAPNTKIVSVLAPISLAGGATATSLVVDTLGWNYVALYAHFGLIGANGIATCKWQESVNSNGSSATDITDASTGALLDADDGKIYGGFLTLGAGRKRYIVISLVNGATNASLCSAFAILYKAQETPTTAAGRGLSGQFAAI